MTRWRVAGPVLAVLSLPLVAALAILDHARATSHGSLRDLGFGWPVNWLVQDQTGFDPPSYPREMRFASPWEHPFFVDRPALVLSFAVVLTLLVGAWFGLSVVRGSVRRTEPDEE